MHRRDLNHYLQKVKEDVETRPCAPQNCDLNLLQCLENRFWESVIFKVLQNSDSSRYVTVSCEVFIVKLSYQLCQAW
jgi:hypothetical protein